MSNNKKYSQPNLFNDVVMDDLCTSHRDEHVVCLGKEFESEEARREYFRDELRRRLPELRNIEGFPIGSDDDIVRLSDPPYYTACPNPWLNDFVQEWEKDKVELEREGKRDKSFLVSEPYASDVSEGKNNPIYMAHAYHTKVPHPAIMRYILHYTQPGDIVFDGFCGTGMTGVAAQLCGSQVDVENLNEQNVKVGIRHAICSDLSPIASLISAAYSIKFDVKTFEQKAFAILEKVDNELGWMYETKIGTQNAKINYTIWSDAYSCSNCGHEITLWDYSVNLEEESIKNEFNCPHCGNLCSKKNMNKVHDVIYDAILNSTITITRKIPVRVNYTHKGKRGEKNIENEDLEILKKIEVIDTSSYRTSKIPKGDEVSRNEKDGFSHIHHFYTKRNFIYLSRIMELVKGDIFLQTWFTSVLLNLSQMYKFRIDRKGSMLYGTFFIPSFNVEFNPYNALKGKIKDYIKANYSNRSNTATALSSATDLTTIQSNSIDYIFTDPPFGSNIMYSELSSIWEGWLNVKTNNQSEAIISNVQNKRIMDYYSLMQNSLKEFFRILKPGKWMTVEFSNTSAAVWNGIQNAIQSVGFVIVNVAALDKKQGSFKAVTTTTAVKQDLVITCYKPTEQLTNKLEDSTDKKKETVDFIEELLLHLPVHMERNQKTTAVVERSPKILFDRLISYYVQHGWSIPMDAGEFQQMLRNSFIERDGMFFTASQALQYEVQRANTAEFVPMALFVSSEAEGIEWLKRVLDDKPQTYQEIQPEWMKAMVTPKKGDRLPELMEILEENFIKDDDDRWRKPDAERAADLEIMRQKKMAKEFALYVEQANKPKAKRMKDCRLEVLRYGFKDCYKRKDYATIIAVGDHIQESLLLEDEFLLQYYDRAVEKTI